MRTIKDVQYDLRLWGNFWARQEEGQGYSNKSNIQAIKEACEVGCASSSTLHLFKNTANSIHVPKHIEGIDNSIGNLDPKCKVALRQRYINRGKILYFADLKAFLFWVRKAERELL